MRGEQKLNKDHPDRRRVIERGDRHYRIRPFSDCGHFVVFRDLRGGRMTDINHGKRRLSILRGIDRGRGGNKDIVEKNEAYKEYQPFHRDTIVKTRGAVNVKRFNKGNSLGGNLRPICRSAGGFVSASLAKKQMRMLL